MWSSASISGSPRILMMDITQNSEGWEHAFFDRLFLSLERSELNLERNAPQRMSNIAESIAALSNFKFNCLLLFSNAEKLRAVWNLLQLQEGLSPFMFAVCNSLSFDLHVSEEVLKTGHPSIPFAIAPLSPMSPREAGLFYLKFFTELKLHSTDQLSGKMIWFSFSKAKELLRRRRYPGKFGVRC